MSTARILLVDDERDLVWAMRHSLSDEGYKMLTAYDGLEALAVARRHRPDLIVLDIIMPRLDGLQVCHRLRRDPPFPSCRPSSAPSCLMKTLCIAYWCKERPSSAPPWRGLPIGYRWRS